MTSAFELPTDDARTGAAVQTVATGNVVFVLRNGQRVGDFTPPNMVLLARKQAVTMARTAATEAREAADSIVGSARHLADASVRERITRPVIEIAEHTEEALAVATIRLALALHSMDEDVSTVWPWVDALPTGGPAEMFAEMDAAVARENDGTPAILAGHLITIWQHTAEAFADPAVYAALTTESSDFGPVPLPEQA